MLMYEGVCCMLCQGRGRREAEGLGDLLISCGSSWTYTSNIAVIGQRKEKGREMSEGDMIWCTLALLGTLPPHALLTSGGCKWFTFTQWCL